MIPKYSIEDLQRAKARDLLPLECNYCKETFYAPCNQIKAAIKGNEKREGKKVLLKFCSQRCSSKAKIIAIPIKCSYCNIDMKRTPNQIKKRANSFCSQSCSAHFYNAKRNNLKGSCKTCNKKITSKLKYCSKECRKIARPKKIADNTTKNNLVKSHYRKMKEKAVEYKGGKCKFCGYKKCLRALQFHHINPSEKDFTISGRNWKWEKIIGELDKCILLCANCHSELHDGLIMIESVG